MPLGRPEKRRAALWSKPSEWPELGSRLDAPEYDIRKQRITVIRLTERFAIDVVLERYVRKNGEAHMQCMLFLQHHRWPATDRSFKVGVIGVPFEGLLNLARGIERVVRELQKAGLLGEEVDGEGSQAEGGAQPFPEDERAQEAP